MRGSLSGRRYWPATAVGSLASLSGGPLASRGGGRLFRTAFQACFQEPGPSQMTNMIAAVLALMILGLFALDALVLHWNLPLFLGRQMLVFIEWVSFWR